MNEIRSNLEIANKKNTDLQLKLERSDELNQNRINDFYKKQQGF